MIQIEKLFNTYLFTKKKRAKTNDPPHKGEQIEIIYFYDSLFIFLVYLALFFILFSVSCVQLFFLLISIFCSLSICHARWWLTHSVKPKKKFYTITLMRQMNFQCLRKQTGVTFFSSILFLLSDDRKHQFPQMIFSTRFLLLFYSVIHIQWRSLFDGMGTLFVCFFFFALFDLNSSINLLECPQWEKINGINSIDLYIYFCDFEMANSDANAHKFIVTTFSTFKAYLIFIRMTILLIVE